MKKTEIISIGITLLVISLLGLTSLYYFKEYGWTVFCFIPFLIGFLPSFIYSSKQDITLNKAYGLSFITLGLVVLGLLIFAIEGIICIAMSLPIAAIFVWLGAYLGYIFSNKSGINNTNVSVIVLLLSFGFMSFDNLNEPSHLIPIKTQVTVNASIENVWNNVVTFNKIDEPTDWIFKTGISYPTDATIKGTGVGAIRYCNFSTGSFVEPITTWNEPNLLQFDVKEQPIPMNEFNPFWDIHPPHLDGYFKSYKGQFQLTKIDSNTTQLEGTTWYKVDITPEFYWKVWSNFIVRKIHTRVLDHIKNESEE